MKKLFLAFGIALLAINSPYLNSQTLPPCDGPSKEMIKPPPFTEQQRNQMKEMRIAHMKEVQPVQNELRELKARYKTLTTASNPVMAEINKNIDAQSAAMNKLMKSRASHQQDIRKILTDEQKLFNDMKPDNARGERFQGKPGPNRGPGNKPGRPDFVPPCMR